MDDNKLENSFFISFVFNFFVRHPSSLVFRFTSALFLVSLQMRLLPEFSQYRLNRNV